MSIVSAVFNNKTQQKHENNKKQNDPIDRIVELLEDESSDFRKGVLLRLRLIESRLFWVFLVVSIFTCMSFIDLLFHIIQ